MLKQTHKRLRSEKEWHLKAYKAASCCRQTKAGYSHENVRWYYMAQKYNLYKCIKLEHQIKTPSNKDSILTTSDK